MDQQNCEWPGTDALMIQYHDEEWGMPLHDDQKLFEFLILDTFQAGLSWRTILHKRENFKKAFANFDPHKIIQFNEEQIADLMQDSGIVRNRLKIYSAISNARLFLEIQQELGSFDHYIWQFTKGKTIQNNIEKPQDIPTHNTASDEMSKALKKRGFKFVGTTICYAFMQASGMINDHLKNCPMHQKCRRVAS